MPKDSPAAALETAPSLGAAAALIRAAAAAGRRRHARNGKVASLPAHIRGEINRRLFDGNRAKHIIEWVHSQPEAVAQLQQTWGEHWRLIDNNISEWRHGGYLSFQEAAEARMMEASLAGLCTQPGGVSRATPAREDPPRAG